jgi:FKBP-type peptidyl-prolyl cis-trans isomerase
VGGQRLLEIPGELAYGEAGNQGIGPNETLVFVIQLDAIG